MSLSEVMADLRAADPDRFAIVLAAPAQHREALAGLFGLNLQIARAGFASAEPMLSLMRLQWWRDAIEAVSQGRRVDGDAVMALVQQYWGAELAGLLPLLDARETDARREAFSSEGALRDYLVATSQPLLSLALMRLGATGDIAPETCLGVAIPRYLMALPQLEALGPWGLDESARQLWAGQGLSALAALHRARSALPRAARIALFPGAGAKPFLTSMAQSGSFRVLSPARLAFSRAAFGIGGFWL